MHKPYKRAATGQFSKGTGGGPGRQYYEGEYHSRTALTAGVSASF